MMKLSKIVLLIKIVKLTNLLKNNKQIKYNFKYINNSKSALHEINKFIISNNYENIDNKQKLRTIIEKMLLEGYFFDMKALTKRKIVKAYLDSKLNFIYNCEDI